MGFESPAEERLYNAIDRSKYDLKVQEKIDEYRVDLLVTKRNSETKLIVECDGHPFHRNLVRDKIRDDYLANQGYSVLHVSARDALKNTKSLIAKIDDFF
jgi:very-short-patch-repair endonuclease